MPPSRLTHGRRARYCSTPCRVTSVAKTCEVCEMPYIVEHYRVETTRACSKRCAGILGGAVKTDQALAASFWDQLVRTDSGCLVWPHATTDSGYGQLTWAGRRWLAHRLAWAFVHGEPALPVLHSCDNPPCCEPTHLHLGTRADNSGEMVERGRSLKGERQPNAKLTEAAVVELRRDHAAGTSLSTLAARYRMSISGVHGVVQRRSWKHVA